jgi:peptidoglycan hydrolase-like protein with peptidoglycan-binding domain
LADSSEIEGAQLRLNNLGFYAGDGITGQLDAQTNRALQRFQTLYKITDAQGDPDAGGTLGTLTAKTTEQLKDKYGS